MSDARKRRPKGSGSIVARKDGRFEVRRTDPTTGRRITKSAPDYATALKIDRDMATRAERGVALKDSRATIKNLVEAWESRYVPTARSRKTGEPWSTKTKFAYRDVVRLHITPVIGSVTIAGADVDTVESVFAEMDRKGLSPNYKRQALKALSSMFDYAVRKRVLAYNPVRLVDPIAGTVQRQTKVPEVDEVKKILAELAAPVVTTERTKGRPRNEAGERERVRVLCLVMAHAGLRISEALGLQWSDVDLEHRRITLVGKGRKRRTIPVTRSLSTELAGWRRQLYKERMSAVWWDSSSDFVIPTGVGSHWDAHNARKCFRRQVDPIHPGLVPHSMRKASATIMIEEGVDPATVAAVLGHSDSRITLEIYKAVHESSLDGAADAMDRALGSGRE